MTTLVERAAALLALAGKATPGPWKYSTEPQPNGCPIIGTSRGLMIAMLAHSIRHAEQATEAIGNAQFIAAAHDMADLIRELLAENERLRTGDTCGRMCEGTAYRIEAQRLRARAAQPVTVTREAFRKALSDAGIRPHATTEAEIADAFAALGIEVTL